MQFVNQFLQLVQQGLATIFRLIAAIWQWTITQISAVPWSKLDQLSIPKIVLLLIVAGVVIYLLYLAGKELLGAGEKLLSAFVAVLTVFVKTLPYIVIAGATAAGGAWVINHVNI
jgi:hypothetical protein